MRVTQGISLVAVALVEAMRTSQVEKVEQAK
jgi:hypothetical protein